MPLSKRLASARATRGVTSLLAAAAMALTPAVALAQTKPETKPAPAKPAPAAPAKPAPAPGQPQQEAAPAGPTLVQVKPEPSQTDWTKVCGKDPTGGKEICYTTRDFVSDQGQPVLAVAVYDAKGEAQKMIRFLMPLGLLLQPGVRFGVDQGQPSEGRFAICFPNGCFAEVPIKEADLGTLKKGTNINVSVQNQGARVVTFQVPLAGFGKSFDGPPIDPKVLEEQQKKLQAELQKKSEEMRKRLEAQGGSAPAPAAPATPPKQ